VRRKGRVVDVGDCHVDRAVPGERGQRCGDRGGEEGRLGSPGGPNLHPDPAAADYDTANDVSGQIRGDLAVPAAMEPGHARAGLDGRCDSIDVDPFDDRVADGAAG
jgi:hypothetical protein